MFRKVLTRLVKQNVHVTAADYDTGAIIESFIRTSKQNKDVILKSKSWQGSGNEQTTCTRADKSKTRKPERSKERQSINTGLV